MGTLNNRIFKNKNLFLFLFLIILFLILIYFRCRYSILNFDDTAIFFVWNKFLSLGYLKSAFILFTNQDIPHIGYRTYGFSKVTQFFLMQLFGSNAYIFAFIMIIMQIISSILLYTIIKYTYKNYEIALFISLIWLISPSTLPQTYHHFSYILLPVYFIIIYVSYNLKAINYINTKKPHTFTKWKLSNVYKNKKIVFIVGTLLALAISFSGETALPLFILVLILLICFSKYHYENKYLLKLYLYQLIISVVCIVLHFFYYKAFVSIGNNTRYSYNFESNLQKDILQFLASISDLFKIILHKSIVACEERSWETYIITFIMVILVICIFGILRDKYNNNELQLKHFLFALLFVVASLIVPFFMAISSNSFILYEVRYGWVIIPIILSFIIINVYCMFKYLVARFICFFLVFFLLFLTLTQFTIVSPIIYKENQQIEHLLKQGKKLGKKAVLLVNSSWHFDNKFFYRKYLAVPGIIRTENVLIDSPFQLFWCSNDYIKNMYGYEIIAYKFKVKDSGTLSLTDLSGRSFLFPKSEVLVLINNDLYYYDNQQIENNIVGYLRWSNFFNSPAYMGIEIYNNLPKNLLSLDSLFYLKYLFGVNLGETEKITTFYKDQNYDYKEGKLCWGWVSGDNSLFNSYSISNRHGNFKYKFSGLPFTPMKIVMDFKEIWQHKLNMRLFSVEIITDSRIFTIDNVDLYKIGKNDTVSIGINIEPTHNLTLKFQKLHNSTDIPFCDNIRFFEMSKATNK